MVHWHTVHVVNTAERLVMLLDSDTSIGLADLSDLFLLSQYYQDLLYEGKTIEDQDRD